MPRWRNTGRARALVGSITLALITAGLIGASAIPAAAAFDDRGTNAFLRSRVDPTVAVYVSANDGQCNEVTAPHWRYDVDGPTAAGATSWTQTDKQCSVTWAEEGDDSAAGSATSTLTGSYQETWNGGVPTKIDISATLGANASSVDHRVYGQSEWTYTVYFTRPQDYDLRMQVDWSVTKSGKTKVTGTYWTSCGGSLGKSAGDDIVGAVHFDETQVAGQSASSCQFRTVFRVWACADGTAGVDCASIGAAGGRKTAARVRPAANSQITGELTASLTLTPKGGGGGGGGACDISGTAGDDILVGTAADETICGFGGNDILRGRGGNDILLGGPGNDRLFGGPGNDVLRAAAGRDRGSGGAGNDRLFGGTGNDILRGGRGSDVVIGGRGRDNLNGDGGRDDLRARDGAGGDRLDGDAGFDRGTWNGGDSATSVEQRY